MKKLFLIHSFLIVFLASSLVSCSDDNDGKLGFNEHPSWLVDVVQEFKKEEGEGVGVVVWYYKYDDRYYYQLHSTKNTVIYYDKETGEKIAAGHELYGDISDSKGKLSMLPLS